MRRLRYVWIALLLAGCAAPPALPPTFTPAPTLTPFPTATPLPPAATPTPTATSAPTSALTASSTPTPTPEPPRASPERSRRVVIISIDGLRPDALQPTRAPNILGLARRGAYTFLAQTIFPPVTLPAHASMLSGYPPEAHGVDWNDYQPARGFILTPTVLSLAHAAGLRAVMVVGKEKFEHFNAPETLDAFVFARNGDQDVADQAIAQIQDGFDVLFIHLPNPDYFGHLTGWMSGAYLFQLTRTDEAVGRILAALPANTTVILTADHGGHGVVHGLRIPEDMTIPWIIAGPGVREDYELTQPVDTMDTAATAAYVMGLTLGPEAEGEVVQEAFVPSEPAAPTATAPPRIRLLFTGDINPGRCPARIALANGDFTLPYQAVADELRAADLTIGSLDGALSDASPPMPCPQSMNLIGPARMVEGLQFAGFDVISVATNHAQDCGASGFGCEGRSLNNTLATLRAAGIAPAGGGAALAEARAPVIVERLGVRFAFLGVCAVCDDIGAGEAQPGVARLSMDELIADIASARNVADVVIVLPQWGVEYTERPTAEQRAWAAQMIEAGAALVVGNHPHIIQPYEAFPDAFVAYALGNFVFDQGPWRTRQGVVLEAVFRGAQLDAWRLLPVHIYDYHQPRWAEGDEAQAILGRVQMLSAELARP